MAISVEENIALLKAIRDEASTAAVPAVGAMAGKFEDDVGRTLRMTFHAPMPAGPPHSIPFGIFYPAAAGAPPAFATGNLARSMMRTPASGGLVASAMVGNTAVYSAVQEWGSTLYPNSAWLHWRNTHGSWFMRSVTVPEHPYFRRTLRFDLANGSLTEAAMKAFEAHMTLLGG